MYVRGDASWRAEYGRTCPRLAELRQSLHGGEFLTPTSMPLGVAAAVATEAMGYHEAAIHSLRQRSTLSVHDDTVFAVADSWLGPAYVFSGQYVSCKHSYTHTHSLCLPYALLCVCTESVVPLVYSGMRRCDGVLTQDG